MPQGTKRKLKKKEEKKTMNKKVRYRQTAARSLVNARKVHPATKGRSSKVTTEINKHIEEVMKAKLIHHGQRLKILKPPKNVEALVFSEKAPKHGKDAAVDIHNTAGRRRHKEMMDMEAAKRKTTKHERLQAMLKSEGMQEVVEKKVDDTKPKDLSKLMSLWKDNGDEE